MDYIFILGLSEHRVLGFIFAPYVIQKERGADNYSVIDRLMLANIEQYKNMLTPEDIQLVHLIEDYNELNLVKLFSKKKLTAREFIVSLEKGDLLQQQVRPYIERRMARCLDILRYNPVPVFHKLLQSRIYGSERIHLAQEDVSTVFNFNRTSDGMTYHLSIDHEGNDLSLTGKNGLIILNEPCCLVLKDTLFVFQDIDGKKLIPFFDKEHLSIPKQAEPKYFDGFVRNAIKKFKVKATGFSIVDVVGKPSKILSIENNLSGNLSIVLKFIYNSTSVYYANKKTEMKVDLKMEGDKVEFTRLQRDYAYENDSITELLSCGLRNEGDAYFKPFAKEKEDLLSAYTVINWLNTNISVLRDLGFEIAQDRMNKSFYIEKFTLSFKVSESQNDWFDVYAVVEFDGFSIPFVAFKNHIENKNKEFILPNERIMILPDEWFESYGDLLRLSKKVGDNLQLNKKYYALLHEGMSGVSGSIKERMLELIEKTSLQLLPTGLNAELRDYQHIGYSWMYNLYKNGFGGCLADDMGLGKTLQTIALLKRLSTEEVLVETPEPKQQASTQLDLFAQAQNRIQKKTKCTLIVVPTSLVHNWVNELNKFAPSLKAATYIGCSRANLTELVSQSDIVITSYGILRNDIEELRKFNFLYLILDESQMIKNPVSKTYQAVMMLKPEYKLVLTGTPIENSLSDLWTQMNFLNQGLLGSLNFFRQEFQTPIEKHGDQNRKKKLQQLIAPFMLRRSKTEVVKELPPLTEQIVYCDMSDEQEAFYIREKSKVRNLVMDMIAQGGLGKSSIVILQSLTKLRQIANHPSFIDSHYMGGSGKFEEIRRNLKSLLASGHKALIFSSFVKHLNLVADFLDQENINYALLTGETDDREKQVNKFQNDASCPFFLVSLKAGGVGLNLTAAEYVLILDPWWNPAAEMQAISRSHRIGQEKQVMVYRFITSESLEEKIIKLQQRKSEIANAFVNENSMKNLSVDDITALFE